MLIVCVCVLTRLIDTVVFDVASSLMCSHLNDDARYAMEFIGHC